MVGRVRGGQDIFLGGRGCWTFGIVLHELGHAIGFWHEQSRPDRDEYLEVLNENILKAYRYNYIKKSRAQVDSMDQVQLDLHSTSFSVYNQHMLKFSLANLFKLKAHYFSEQRRS